MLHYLMLNVPIVHIVLVSVGIVALVVEMVNFRIFGIALLHYFKVYYLISVLIVAYLHAILLLLNYAMLHFKIN